MEDGLPFLLNTLVFNEINYNLDYDNFFVMLNEGADIIDYAQKMGKAILVHCKRGHHRSASIVVFYLMKYQGMSLVDAICMVKAKRPTAFARETCLLRTLIQIEVAN